MIKLCQTQLSYSLRTTKYTVHRVAGGITRNQYDTSLIPRPGDEGSMIPAVPVRIQKSIPRANPRPSKRVCIGANWSKGDGGGVRGVRGGEGKGGRRGAYPRQPSSPI